MTSLKLDQLNIVVSDLARSVVFWRRLGVETEDPGPAPHVNGHAGDVSVDFDTATFAQVWNAAWAGREDLAGRVVIGFKTETREAVDEHYASVTAAGHRGLQPPFDAFWGARYAIVEAPDGVAVGLMSPIDPARRGEPG
jgi:catechol 2,3-dioxygenase-like lactoylglutathione lyase family enzyme